MTILGDVRWKMEGKLPSFSQKNHGPAILDQAEQLRRLLLLLQFSGIIVKVVRVGERDRVCPNFIAVTSLHQTMTVMIRKVWLHLTCDERKGKAERRSFQEEFSNSILNLSILYKSLMEKTFGSREKIQFVSKSTGIIILLFLLLFLKRWNTKFLIRIDEEQKRKKKNTSSLSLSFILSHPQQLVSSSLYSVTHPIPHLMLSLFVPSFFLLFLCIIHTPS